MKLIMERTVFNKAQLEMLDIMANVRSDEEPGNGMNRP